MELGRWVAWAATIAFVAYHLGAAAAATIGRLGPVCAAVAITGAATVFIVNRVRRANVRKRNVLARPRLSFAKTPSGSRDRVHASDMSKQRRWSRPTDHRAGILSGSKPRDQPTATLTMMRRLCRQADSAACHRFRSSQFLQMASP